MEHILLKKAHRYTNPETSKVLGDYAYNSKKGYWISGLGEALVNSKNPPIQNSKKCDRETGEDQKGE